jgi:SAM-dependent methyltransferase
MGAVQPRSATSGYAEPMNTAIFTGKASAYAAGRPGYPPEAMDYICSLVPASAVFADIGAGTGKFTELLAEREYKVFAVEPNADMRAELEKTMAPYQNAKIVAGTAEMTTLPDDCADVITCAQALHWFDPATFRAECHRIGKPGALVVSVYNTTPGGSSLAHCESSTEAFFNNPALREFPNPQFYSRAGWLTYMTSHSHDPLPSDERYAEHLAEVNAVFDQENVGGLLRRDVVTMIYTEPLTEIP